MLAPSEGLFPIEDLKANSKSGTNHAGWEDQVLVGESKSNESGQVTQLNGERGKGRAASGLR